MNIFQAVSKLKPTRIWDGVLARTVNGERLSIGFVDIDPNVQVPEHRHENEQMGFVIRGDMEMKIGDDSRRLTAGQAYSIPSNVPHSVITGPEGCVVMDIFAPVRADWETLERDDPSPGSWPTG